MDLLRRYLFIYLLPVVLLSSSTTTSDHTDEWKGGEGAKGSRVRRQNLHPPDALRLPEKAYALYVLWRLLNEVSNDTNPIRTSTMTPDKLESVTSEGPKNTEIVFKAEDEPCTHSTGITVMASLPTDPSLTDLQTTTQSGDSQQEKQSPQRLQTTQKISEPSLVTDQQIPDPTTLAIKIYHSTIIHEPIGHFTGITGTKDSTAMASLPTHSQKTTQSGDSQLVEQLTISKPKMTEPSQVTEQHIPDYTTLSIKISSKAVKELSPTTIHDQIAGFTDMTGTPDSPAIMSFHTDQPSQSKQSTQHFQSPKIASTEYRNEKETPLETTINSHIPNHGMLASTRENASRRPTSPLQTMKHEHPRRVITGMEKGISRPTLPAKTKTPTLSSSAVKLEVLETASYKYSVTWHNGKPNQFVMATNRRDPKPTPPSFTLKQQIQDSTPLLTVESPNSHINGFTTDPEPHKPTPAEEPTNQHTNQLLPDSTTLTNKIPSKAVEEPSLHKMHEESTPSTVANDSPAITSFPTELTPEELQNNSQSGGPRLFTQQSTQHLQQSKQEISEPSQVKEQLIPDPTTLTIKISSKAAEESSSTIIHEPIGHFTGITDTKDSTAMAYLPTHSQKTTQSGDSQLVEQLTISKQKMTEPSQVTEQHIPDPTTLTIKIPSKVVDENSPTTIHDQIEGFTDMTGTPDSPTITSFPTELPPQEPQNNTQSQLFTQQSTQHLQQSKQEISEPSQVTEQHIPDPTTLIIKISSKAAEESSSTIIHEPIGHFTGITDTKDSTTMTSLPTHSQKTTQSGDSQLVEPVTISKPKMTEPSFTLKQQIQDSTSLLTVESPKSHINGFTADPEPHKPTPAEEPTNQHTEKNAINTAKSSRDSLTQHFMTTRILTKGSSASRKTDSTSRLTEDYLVDSRESGDTSSSAPFRINQSITNKYPIFGTIMSHTSVPLVKDTSTQSPKDRVRSSQTIPVSTEKLTVTFAPNPKPSEKHFLTSDINLTLRTQEILSWISTKQSNVQPTETTGPRSGLANREPTADTVAKENHTKPTQSTIGRKTTRKTMSKTQKVTNSKTFITPTHKSADAAIIDDKQTHRGVFGLLFTLGCLILLIIVILLRVVWKRWQTRHWRNNNMWVAGHPLLYGTYRSVWQTSSLNTAIEMPKGKTQKNKQNRDVYERIALKQQHKDLH